MSISAKLAEALHRINALVPHRDEQSFLDVKDAIDGEEKTPEPAKEDDDENSEDGNPA